MKLDKENLRILLVDDNDEDCELVRTALIHAGFTHPLTRLRNGGITMEYSRESEAKGALVPHIILLDLNMPVVDGVHALQQLRATSLFRDVPVIIFSGDDDVAKRRAVAHLGIFRFLKKESKCANVISALDDFLGLYNHEVASSMA